MTGQVKYDWRSGIITLAMFFYTKEYRAGAEQLIITLLLLY